MQAIEVKPATQRDVSEYYGGIPKATINGFMFKLDGRTVGVFGLAWHGKTIMAFSEFKEEMKPYLRTMPVFRSMIKMKKLLEQCRIPVFAMADEIYGPELLTKMGFKHLYEDYYVWQQ